MAEQLRRYFFYLLEHETTIKQLERAKITLAEAHSPVKVQEKLVEHLKNRHRNTSQAEYDLSKFRDAEKFPKHA